MNAKMKKYNSTMIEQSQIIQNRLFELQINELKNEKPDMVKYTNLQNVSLTWMKTMLALGMIEEDVKIEVGEAKK